MILYETRMAFHICINFLIFAFYGALAQLARVLDWQSRGHGFDSHTLHIKTEDSRKFLLLSFYCLTIFRALLFSSLLIWQI